MIEQTKFSPQEIVAKFGSIAYQSIDYSLSNEFPELQARLADYFIANQLASIHEKIKDRSKDFFKDVFADKLKTVGEFDLMTVAPFQLTAKIANPRETFDKDAFINAVSEKWDLSVVELRAVAATCTKTSAAPISFKVAAVTDGMF